jgi:hypothetical protein
MPDIETTAAPIQSERWMRFETADKQLAYMLTGVAPVTIKGSGGEWKYVDYEFDVPIPDLGPGKALELVRWAHFVTPCWISNDRTASNAGWAVTSFDLVNPGAPQYGKVEVTCEVGVRDIDGFVNGLGFSISLLGTEVD